jgi:DNA-binding CsgD family transcriptional regulator
LGDGAKEQNRRTSEAATMTSEEQSVIVGMWRSGASYQEIGMVFGIHADYVKMIIDNYIKKKK